MIQLCPQRCSLGILLFMAALLIPLQSAAETIQAETRIGRLTITVTGNERTRTGYIQYLVTDCIVEERIASPEEMLPALIEQCLLNSKLFSEVEANISGTAINLAVKERWTLLPIPYYYTSNDEYTAGLFLMENNLFGLGKKGAIGGSLSSYGSSYSLFYYDPALFLSDWNASLRIGSKEVEPALEHDDREYYAYEVEEFFYGASLGRKIFLPELLLAIGLNGVDKNYDRVDTYPPPEDYDAYSLSIHAVYKNTDFKFYFNEGLRVDLDFETQLHRSDDNQETRSWGISLDWQKQYFGRNVLQFQLQLQGITDATIGDALLLGSGKGFRGVESQGLWVNSAAALSLDYQIPVCTYDYGTWTVAPFIDLAAFDPIIDIPADSFVSAGIGGYLYLRNIAFPGVGLVLGYNDEFKGTFVSFSLGMRF